MSYIGPDDFSDDTGDFLAVRGKNWRLTAFDAPGGVSFNLDAPNCLDRDDLHMLGRAVNLVLRSTADRAGGGDD